MPFTTDRPLRHIPAGHAELDDRPRGIENALHAYLRWERNLPDPAPGAAAFLGRSAPTGEQRLCDAGFRLARGRFLGGTDGPGSACAAGYGQIDA